MGDVFDSVKGKFVSARVSDSRTPLEDQVREWQRKSEAASQKLNSSKGEANAKALKEFEDINRRFSAWWKKNEVDIREERRTTDAVQGETLSHEKAVAQGRSWIKKNPDDAYEYSESDIENRFTDWPPSAIKQIYRESRS